MALTKTQVSELYVAIFNRASEGAGNSWWQEESATKSAAEIATEMLATDAAKEYFGASLDSDLEFIKHIYLNTLGKTYADDQAGIDWWVTQLAGNTRGEIVVALIEAIQDEQYKGTDAQQQFLNRVEVSDYTAENLDAYPENYKQSLGFNGDLEVTSNPGSISPAKKAVQELAVEQGEGGEGGEGQPSKGQTFFLTEGRDKLEGTDGADTFYGFVGQNQNGTLANELATGDIIDGGAGRDKIIASLQADLNADSGAVASVNPRTTNVEEVHIEALDTAITGGRVLLDAGRMDSVEEFWSDNSSTDFEIRDVRLGSKLGITKDVTFGLRETDFGTNFTALFDSQSLTAASSKNVNSALSIRVADVSALNTDKPLANVKMDLSFKLGAETVTLTDIVADGGTYLGLVTAIRTALKDAGLESLDVAVGAQYNSVTFAGNTVNLPFTASELLIVDPNGESFTDINFIQSSIQSVPGGFMVAGNADNAPPSVTSNLIESNLILDNAGRGSTAGDVLIGGMSNSAKGVEQFNVTVDRSSKIASLNTTHNKLQNIIIDSKGANGSLTIGETQDNLLKIDANGFKGDSLTIGTADAVFNLESLNAGSTSADVTFVADYDGTGRASDKQKFFIQTGAGNDLIDVVVDGLSTSTSTATSLDIDAGNGNNVVIVNSDNSNVADTVRNAASKETVVTVTTGSGADVVYGNGADLVANTGAGNDVIYAENTGAKAILSVDATNGILAAAATDIKFLYGRQIQVTLDNDKAANGKVVGFESKVIDIVTDGARLTTVDDLNNAILKAVNEDPVLSKLAIAKVDSNKVVYIEYLVDGEQNVAGVKVDFLGAVDTTKLTPSDWAKIEKDYRAEVQNSTFNVKALFDAAVVPGTTNKVSVDGNSTHLTTVAAAAVVIGESIEVAVGDVTVSYKVIAGDTVNTVAGALAEALSDAGVQAKWISGTATFNIVSSETPQFGNVNVTATPGASSVGTASTTHGQNFINAGTGDDVIVLSTHAGANDIIKVDAGGFGNDTIVHFTAGVNVDRTDDAKGADIIDFSAYLNNVTSASGSVESQVTVTTTLAGAGAMTANSVTVVDFNTLTAASGGGIANDKFATMSNAEVLAALNNDATFGTAIATANLVGSERKAILMVQNKGGAAGTTNEGLYKVYEVTMDNANAVVATNNFTSATLVGSFDFSEQQGFTVDNFIV